MKTTSFLLTLVLISLSLGLKAQNTYNYNQNANFTKLKEGKWFYKDALTYKQDNMEMTRISMGKKDIEGNELYKYHLKSDKYEFYLVPDNEFYPLAYRLMELKTNTEGFRIRPDGGKRLHNEGYIVLNNSQIARVNFDLGYSSHSDNGIDSKAVIYIYANNFFQGRLDFKISSYSFIQGKGKGTPYSTFIDFLNGEGIPLSGYNNTSYGKNRFPGVMKLYKHFDEYKKNLLKYANSKSVTELLAEFEEGEYRMVNDQFTNAYTKTQYKDINLGKIKLFFEKEDGKVKNIKVQNCFSDGEFYDKDKFFVNFSLDGNGRSNDIQFVPYDGRILLVDKNGNIGAVFTKNFQDAVAWQLVVKRFWTLNKSDVQHYCKSQFEMEYDEDKDPYVFRNFFKKYLNALK